MKLRKCSTLRYGLVPSGFTRLRSARSIHDAPYSGRSVPYTGGIVPQRLEALSCTSLNMGSRENSVPLTFVTLQEQRCVLGWYFGWNAVQKQRFLEDLISKAVPGKVSSLLDQLNTLQVNDRPPNIFECQLRLWTQWFDSWSEEERNAFLNSLEEKDPTFVAYFYSRVAGTAGRD
ncbi:uncharacterized protein C14orf119 homolog isoform X2 [Siphateles boraxobius]|uniref:uncharacterized protein C14orf119 homolog isoform X2 n=1 Tax=Siphateles boraxobius TaxID=180520 RepID=UPI0040637BDE